MKAKLLLLPCIALLFSVQAWAASDSQSCETRSQQLRGAAKESFLSSCLSETLTQTSSPERVRALTAQEKRNTCEQNAKNMKMDGTRKASYINDCINSNDAAIEAKKAGVPEQASSVSKTPNRPHTQLAAAPSTTTTEKHATKRAAKKQADAKPKVSVKTCVKNANKEKLKGAERKHYISECRKG